MLRKPADPISLLMLAGVFAATFGSAAATAAETRPTNDDGFVSCDDFAELCMVGAVTGDQPTGRDTADAPPKLPVIEEDGK
jgi:hypothetical protein